MCRGDIIGNKIRFYGVMKGLHWGYSGMIVGRGWLRGFRIWGLGLWILHLGLTWGLGALMQGVGCGAYGLEFRKSVLDFGKIRLEVLKGVTY